MGVQFYCFINCNDIIIQDNGWNDSSTNGLSKRCFPHRDSQLLKKCAIHLSWDKSCVNIKRKGGGFTC